MPEKPRILIVDDERDIVHGLTIRLRAAGYEVLTAGDGPTGIDLATASQPDAILLDIRMPGMDGLEVLGVLKKSEKTSAIPVIAVSANVLEKVKTQAISLGAFCFVAKPFQAELLMSAMAGAVGAGPVSFEPLLSPGGVT